MTNLGRRLSALEAIAEEIRLRPYRELAAEHGISFDELLTLVERARAERAALRAQGLSDREIVEREAARLGMDPDELWREAQELAARINGR